MAVIDAGQRDGSPVVRLTLSHGLYSIVESMPPAEARIRARELLDAAAIFETPDRLPATLTYRHESDRP